MIVSTALTPSYEKEEDMRNRSGMGVDGWEERVMGQEEGKEGTEKRSGNDTMRFTSHLRLVTVE